MIYIVNSLPVECATKVDLSVRRMKDDDFKIVYDLVSKGKAEGYGMKKFILDKIESLLNIEVINNNISLPELRPDDEVIVIRERNGLLSWFSCIAYEPYVQED